MRRGTWRVWCSPGACIVCILFIFFAALGRYVIETVLMPHVPVHSYDFFPKAIYLGHMARRMLLAMKEVRCVGGCGLGRCGLGCVGAGVGVLFEVHGCSGWVRG